MNAKRRYITALTTGSVILSAAVVTFLVVPEPWTMDLPMPLHWQLTYALSAGFAFLGATILWLTGSFGYIYSDVLWRGPAGVQYFLAILVGLPITVFFIMAVGS